MRRLTLNGLTFTILKENCATYLVEDSTGDIYVIAKWRNVTTSGATK